MASANAIVALVLLVLLASTFCVVHSILISTPWLHTRISLHLTTTSIIPILILLAAVCVNSAVIRDGVVGTEGVKPYNTIILFFSLAYTVITLEASGALQAATRWVSNRSENNGWKHYLYFYVLPTVASTLPGHDPAILSGMFLDYHTQVAELGPLAWATAKFAAANIASMLLFVGNPTNVVICEGFGINSAIFTAYTTLPFVACNIFIFSFVAMVSQYYRQAPPVSTPTTPHGPQEVCRDPVAIYFGSSMLVTTLVFCLVVSFFGIDVWMISLRFAICKFLFDCGWDFYHPRADIPIEPTRSEEEMGEESYRASAPGRVELSGPPSLINRGIESEPGTSTVEGARPPRRHDSQNSDKVDHKIQVPKMESPTSSNDPALEGEPGDDTEEVQSPTHGDDFQRDDHKTTSVASQDLRALLHKRFPTVMTALPRLPIGLVLQSILVEALNRQGWVNNFGDWLVQASNKQVYPTIWLFGVLGVILCNIPGTRIGATILLTKVARATALPYDANLAAAIALAIASYVGAVSFTFQVSLADLLWRSVPEQKEILVARRAFTFWNLLLILSLTTVGLGVVSAEMAIPFSL